MSLIISFSSLVNALGGTILIALGAFVATRRPPTTHATLFAIYCMAFGLTAVFFYGVTRTDPLFYLTGTSAFIAGAALFHIALTYPSTPVGGERRVLLLPALVALGYALLAAPATTPFPWDWPTYLATWQIPAAAAGPWYVWMAGFITLVAAHLFAIYAFTLRAWGAVDAAEVRRLAILTGTLALYPGIAYGVISFAGDGTGPVGMVVMALLVLVAGLWLAMTVRQTAPRTARNVALVVLAAPTTGLVVTAFLGLQGAFQGGVFAFLRTAVVLVLGHEMLRHQLLGIDVKLRWTISKTTVAAVFIAVFFVASEAAQEFFGEALGSTYVGILAAGALVFAIAPLSRVADHLAAKAVPMESGATGDGSSALAEYRTVYRAATRDGHVSPEEELALTRLADRLGLGAEAVLELRRDVEKVRRGIEPADDEDGEASP